MAAQRAGLVSFTVKGVHAHDLAQGLDAAGVAVRAGHHCTMPLHDRLGIAASLRASFYLYNSIEEVDTLAVAVEQTQRYFA
jgi:cysteine desulfurase/selenocysteine lyase